jgi:choline dehydrogenase-like flavoprotein
MNTTSIKRRQLLLAGTGALGMAAWPAVNAAKPRKQVIVIGGGMAGATLAKYLRLWGDRVGVTLIERAPRYTSCIMSSLVLTGQRQIADLRYSYAQLKKAYGVKVVTGSCLLPASTLTPCRASPTPTRCRTRGRRARRPRCCDSSCRPWRPMAWRF